MMTFPEALRTLREANEDGRNISLLLERTERDLGQIILLNERQAQKIQIVRGTLESISLVNAIQRLSGVQTGLSLTADAVRDLQIGNNGAVEMVEGFIERITS